MNSELPDELNEQLRVLVGLVSQQAAALSGMSASMNSIANVAARNNTSLNQLNKAQQKENNASVNNNAGTTKLQETTKQYKEITDKAIEGLTTAANLGKNSILDFGRNVLSTQEGFAKYNSTISQVGDAALEFGKVFGILGTAVGGIIKIFTKVLEYQTQQADGIFKAYDSIAQMGAAGTITSREILDMGHRAGLTSLELDKLIEPMKSVRGGFVALGGTTSEGIKRFGEMTAVSEQVRREFKRLGMGDQERNQIFADFTNLMNESGTSAKMIELSQGGLQQAGLNYARQMYVLADITGQTVDEAKAKYEAQMANLETALFENKLDQDRIAAEKELESATTAEARNSAQRKLEKIKKDQEGYKTFTTALMQAGLTQEQITAAQRQYLSGAINDTSVQFAQWGIDLDSMIAKAKAGELKVGDTAQEVKEGFQKTVNNLGQTTIALDPQTAKNMGLNAEMIKRATQQATTDYRKTFENAVGKIAMNEAGSGKVATDPAQAARNNLIEAERVLKVSVDRFAADINPLLGNTGILKGFGVVATTAAILLGTIAAFKLTTAGVGLAKRAFSALGGSKTTASVVTTISAKTKEETSLAGMAAKSEDQVVKGIQFASQPKSSIAGKLLLAMSTGLAGFGNAAVPMLVGATKLSAAIIAVGAAIAAANVIISKATVPYLAKGLHKFDKVDGPKLEILGTALAGLGAAFAVGVGGNMITSLDFFSSMGDDVPVDDINKQVLQLQELDINEKRVALNTELLLDFSKTVFLSRAAEVKLASSDMITNALEGITNFFGSSAPYDQLKEFSKLEVDSAAVKKNATSFKLFAEAMAAFQGTGSGLGAIGTVFAEATAKFFDVRPPLEQAMYFSYLEINAKQTKNNADAFRLFSEAMSTYKGYGSGLGTLSAAIGDAAVKFFGVKPPVDQFANFANLNIDPNKIQKNTDAFMNFTTAMSDYRPGPGLLDSINNLFSGGSSYFNKGGPVFKFQQFAKTDFVKDKKSGKMDEGLLSQYLTSVGTEAFIGEAPAAPIIEKGKEAASSVLGSLADVASTAWDKAKGVWDSVKIHNVIKFTSQSGQYENFIALNPPMQEAVLAAATEYKQVTGNKLQMNSGRRKLEDQQRIYDTSVRNGTPGRQPNGRLVAKPNPNAPHIKGNAIDLQQGINDTARTNQILAKYKLKNKYGKADLPHYDLYAKDGGVFTGPGSGYPIELHGSEIVVPLNPNSLLMRLSQITADSVEQKKLENTLSGKQSVNGNFELYSRIVSQLDQVFWLIDNTHDYDKKMLREELF